MLPEFRRRFALILTDEEFGISRGIERSGKDGGIAVAAHVQGAWDRTPAPRLMRSR
jgi:hypothetical protein